MIAATGSYSASRFPGYPVPELVGARLEGGGPLWMNGATALCSAAAVVAFALCLRAAGARAILPAAGALAFTRVVYIQSTASMDYLWALAPLLAGFWCALRGRPVLAGCLVGLAAGCRPTSILMALPCALAAAAAPAAAREDRAGPSRARPDLRAAIALVAATAAVAALAWSPVAIQYGERALAFSRPPEPIPPAQILRTATYEVWGRLGAWALGAAVLALALDAARGRIGAGRRTPALPRERAALLAAAVAVAVALALFLALPREAGYLIPAVPFAILLLERFLDRRAFAATCLAIAASSFVSFGAVPPREGTIFRDHATRVATEGILEDLLAWPEANPERNVVVVGGKMLARLKARLPYEALGADPHAKLPPATTQHPVSRGSTVFVAELDDGAMRTFAAAGVKVHTAIGTLPEESGAE